MTRTSRIILVSAFGVALVAGGGVSAAAMNPAGLAVYPSMTPPPPPPMTPPTPPSLPPTMPLPSTPYSTPPTSPTMPLPTPPSTTPPSPTMPLPTPTTMPPPDCPSAENTVQAPPTEDEIKALYTTWRDTVGEHDADKVSKLYAPDAVLQPTFSAEVRVGRDAIKAYFTKLFQDHPQVQASLADRKGLKIFGENGAADYGLYNFIPVPGGPAQEARYTFVYQRCGTSWLIVNHHSSLVPQPAR